MATGKAGQGIQSDERPIVEVYDQQGELIVCCTLQELILKAFFSNLDMASGIGNPPWPVAVAGVFVAPITADEQVTL